MLILKFIIKYNLKFSRYITNETCLKFKSSLIVKYMRQVFIFYLFFLIFWDSDIKYIKEIYILNKLLTL